MDRSLLSSGATLAHSCVLVLVLGWGLWPARRDRGVVLCGLFVSLWTDLVLTALILAPMARLGDRIAYSSVSALLAVAMATLLRASLSRVQSSDLAPPGPAAPDTAPAGQVARLAFGLCIVVAAGFTAVLCFGLVPDNYDSVAYRLPRAFLYIGQGTLSHVGGGDFRMQYYPFDMTLAYLAFAIHGLAGAWMNVFGFVAWLVGGVAVWRTAREFGAGRSASLFAAALYLTVPAVLVSASSGNDDMIAGVPLVIGVLFAVRWWRSVALVDAILAAMGFGLSAGSKLHLPFVAPVAALFVVGLATRLARQGRLWASLRGRTWHAALALVIVGLLTAPAIAVNLKQSGHATPQIPNFENVPFSPAVAGINTALFSANLFLSPIPDLDLDPSMQARKRVYDAFNDWLDEHLFFWVSPSLHYSNEPYYRFEGTASSDAYWGVWEQSAWLGFAPWLLAALPFAAWRSWRRDQAEGAAHLRSAAVWLTAGFFGWHLARCCLLLYIGGAGIYYAFIMALAAPAVAWLWQAGGATARSRAVVRALCVAVLAGNMVSAANAWAFNVQRTVPAAVARLKGLPGPPIVGPDLTADLAASRRTLIAYTEWEEPLFDMMSVQPKARYVLTGEPLPAGPVPGFDLSILLARIRSEYGELPLQFDHDDRTRLALIGGMRSVYGEQRAFGRAPPPPLSSITVARYAAASDSGGLRLSSGWSPTEHTHRWSDGQQSTIEFDGPAGPSACTLDLDAITLGPQHVTATMNGEPAGAFDLDAPLAGEAVSLPLPGDGDPGHLDRIVLSFDSPRHAPGDDRALAIGIVNAAVTCRPDASRGPKAVFDYHADGDAGSAAFTRGWSLSERTHRWSDASKSYIDFTVPAGASACAFNLRAISAGQQTIHTTLNGTPIGLFELNAWFPGRDLRLALPDANLRPGAINEIGFHFAAHGDGPGAHPCARRHQRGRAMQHGPVSWRRSAELEARRLRGSRPEPEKDGGWTLGRRLGRTL